MVLGGFAAKGSVMFVMIGVLVGLAVAFGPLSFLQSLFDRVAEGLVTGTAELFTALLAAVPYTADHPDMVEVISVAVAVTVPGAVALGVIMIARGAATMRRAVTAVALVAALASFAVLPAATALTLVAFVAVAGVLAVFVEGAVIGAPLAALATLLSVRFVTLLWRGEASEVFAAAETLAELSGTPSALGAWRVALTVVAAAPFVAAARVVLRD